MASVKLQENMLLTEHFTWSPISLIDDIINSANEVLYKCTDTFEIGLSSADPAILGFAEKAAAEGRTANGDEDGNPIYPEAKLEIEEGILKLETLMENAVDKNFDRLEIWTLRNVLCLPREVEGWVRLGHYEDLTIPPKDNTITPESLHALRRKLQETQKLHAALLAEKTRNDAQIAKLRSLLQPSAIKRDPRSSSMSSEDAAIQSVADTSAPFAFLTHSAAAQNLGIQPLPPPPTTATATTTSVESKPTPLTTHTQFATSQLPHLRSLLACLRPHLATTALPVRHNGAKEELAKDRKVYIESQSKRILERRGVDTRDGVEGAGEGSRVRGDEVRGLESLVAGMRKGGGDVEMDRQEEEEGDGEGEAMDTS